jgi:melanoma-associated antigen
VSASTNAWVLTSILPLKYHDPNILPPPRIPTVTQESSYVGLYTFIIATIYLAGGTLPEAKLERYLRRTNADHSTPADKTDKLLQHLIKEGYIVKIRDSSSGEELVDYMVGPRGKVEVGEDGVAEFVKKVYGQKADEDLDKRLERSLGLGQRRPPTEQGTMTTNGASDGGKKRGRTRQARTEGANGMDEEDEDEGEDG